jgi:hypothetical protein
MSKTLFQKKKLYSNEINFHFKSPEKIRINHFDTHVLGIRIINQDKTHTK